MADRPPRPPGLLAGFALLVLLHAYLALAAFASPGDLLSARPIFNVDWSSQYYWSFAAVRLLETSGRLWGFDPYYMAGYPLGFVFNSSLPVQLLSTLLPGVPLGAGIKLFYLLSVLSVPVLLYAALRNFSLDPLPALAGAALGTTYYWLAEPGLFAQWGMLSGSFLLVFFLWPLSLWQRWLETRESRALLLSLAALPAAFLIHKTAFVLLPLPMLLALAARGTTDKKNWAALIGLGLATLAANLWWLVPFARFLPFKTEDPATTFFQNDDWLRWAKDLFPGQAYFGLALGRDLLFGLGLYGLLREKAARAVLPALVFFGLLAYFGSHVETLRHLQPYRYISAFFLLLTVPAAFGLGRLYRAATARQQRLGRFAVAGFVALLITLHFLPNYRLFYYAAPLRSTLDGPTAALHAWLEKHTDRSGRILIEDNNLWEGKQRTYGGARYPGLLPALLQRECIGGPLPNAFILHHRVDFSDGRLGGRLLANYSDDLLLKTLDLYNIRWIVSWSAAAGERFDALAPAVFPAAEFGGLRVFVVKSTADFFWQGRGRVRADFDRIELEGLVPEDGRVVIKYHYLEGFRSRPAAQLVRVPVADDPIGFLGILNPPPQLELVYDP